MATGRRAQRATLRDGVRTRTPILLEELRIWQRDRLSRVVREDLRDLEQVRDIALVEQLVDLLPERVGSLLSVSSLREDLEVDYKTAERWLTILERLYVCFRILPFGAKRIRALKLADVKARAVFFSGEEGQKRRTQNIVDFHDDPATAVLFATDAGGVGLNLQRAANCTINLELPWNPAVLEQRIGRIYRLGQKRPINVYHLVTQEGIEARIALVVADKKALFTGLFDGKSNEIQFANSGSFLERIERLIDPVIVPPRDTTREAGDEDLSLGDTALLEPNLDIDIDADGLAPDQRPDTAARPDSMAALAAAARPAAATFSGNAQVGDFFSQIRVTQAGDGGITIQAPPEAAQTLAAMFSGVAQLLAATAGQTLEDQ